MHTLLELFLLEFFASEQDQQIFVLLLQLLERTLQFTVVAAGTLCWLQRSRLHTSQVPLHTKTRERIHTCERSSSISERKLSIVVKCSSHCSCVCGELNYILARNTRAKRKHAYRTGVITCFLQSTGQVSMPEYWKHIHHSQHKSTTTYCLVSCRMRCWSVC